MGRCRLAAIECNYKEMDRQLKEQFIHVLNDNDILAEIIRELPNTEEGICLDKKSGSPKPPICNNHQFK